MHGQIAAPFSTRIGDLVTAVKGCMRVDDDGCERQSKGANGMNRVPRRSIW